MFTGNDDLCSIERQKDISCQTNTESAQKKRSLHNDELANLSDRPSLRGPSHTAGQLAPSPNRVVSKISMVIHILLLIREFSALKKNFRIFQPNFSVNQQIIAS